MTVYVIAQLQFKDRAVYNRYQAAFAPVFARHKGTVLAADDQPTVLEGDWPRDKVVLLSFPDEDAYREWADSPEYQAIAVDRVAGADNIALLVRGIDRLPPTAR
jgi:uncharacterized protein (DUF1330 family)